jgi:hypothetical protein
MSQYLRGYPPILAGTVLYAESRHDPGIGLSMSIQKKHLHCLASR